MSPESSTYSSESDAVDFNLKETELTLGPPGIKTGNKRSFFDTVDLHLATPTHNNSANSSNNFLCSTTKSQTPNEEVVGWPPVRASRKNAMKSCKYVKVAMDGAPYLRKVDLEMYKSYDQLLRALETMFSCLTIRNGLNEKKVMDIGNGIEYMPTYEDIDGDWMLVGDVPWKMFVESCKRIRLMISSETIGLGTMSGSKCKGAQVKRINGTMISC
ncbi:PREDICTED: auxin-responsive protein IAA1-like [Lupinus angustifolius]|uniref:auxin-responsive protein IAA1-like n=1 Tax=Lupinus angustifolius TaxID=3871 RepID=UPI00092FD24E|nr:PREDICTED: auxin-responsive protein IAA1-like [Lupinus angustifolius]